jgi:hypothetical protein
VSNAPRGFDDRFKRLGEMGRRHCEAAFLERHICDVPLVFHKPDAPSLVGDRPC